MNAQFERIRDDLAAFADDDHDVILEPSGQLLLVRGGTEISARLVAAPNGDYAVEIDGSTISYRRFLSHTLARLDVLAQKICAKRPASPAFVNGPATLDGGSQAPNNDKALALLAKECTEPPPFAARVVFITGDAGHGKSWLLHEYQALTARQFVEGKSPFLFWHVNLQGRQLLRLSEALMGDLAELRFAGLWIPGLIRLLQYRLLVLAVDGFDELAAEQGSTDALGALALLVRQVEGSGTIVAASRRTFFDSRDYIKRTGMLRAAVSSDCEFHQIDLLNWRREDVVEFLRNFRLDGKTVSNPEATYEETVGALGGQAGHPLLTRPFLVAQLAKGLLLYGESPSQFIKGMADPQEGVPAIVGAFITREVTEKWRTREGEAYLTSDQHVRLLASVAEEMWRNQSERLRIEDVETCAMALFDEWRIPQERRQQILLMVKMHVLLVVPPEAGGEFRSFDHPSLRDYFVACALADYLKGSVEAPGNARLGRFLSLAPLSDAVARYAATLLRKANMDFILVIAQLRACVALEWRATHLQANIGTLVPFLLDGLEPAAPVDFDARALYSSVVFERTTLRRVTLRNGGFVHVSFQGVDWEDVTFVQCDFTEAAFDEGANYRNVLFDACTFNGIRIFKAGEEVLREYAPGLIQRRLVGLGIEVRSGSVAAAAAPAAPVPENARRRLVRRVLQSFNSTTVVAETFFEKKFKTDHDDLFGKVIPLLEEKGILVRRKWRGKGTPQGLWALARDVEDVERAAGGEGDPPLVEFWREIDQ